MQFRFIPLRNQIIKWIYNNPITGRSTDIINPFLLIVTLFFSKYKSVILNELYYKNLINLHGDVDLFIGSKSLKDIKYINITASLTEKGKAYYKMNIQPEIDVKENLSSTKQRKQILTIVR